jgi:hypothetical protein
MSICTRNSVCDACRIVSTRNRIVLTLRSVCAVPNTVPFFAVPVDAMTPRMTASMRNTRKTWRFFVRRTRMFGEGGRFCLISLWR